jgi:hypothetical protein
MDSQGAVCIIVKNTWGNAGLPVAAAAIPQKPTTTAMPNQAPPARMWAVRAALRAAPRSPNRDETRSAPVAGSVPTVAAAEGSGSAGAGPRALTVPGVTVPPFAGCIGLLRAVSKNIVLLKVYGNTEFFVTKFLK